MRSGFDSLMAIAGFGMKIEAGVYVLKSLRTPALR